MESDEGVAEQSGAARWLPSLKKTERIVRYTHIFINIETKLVHGNKTKLENFGKQFAPQ